MDDMKRFSTELPGQDMTFLGDTQYVYHCHHFNLFHDQTVEDALGEAKAFEVRSRAAADAVRPLLAGLAEGTGASLPAERLLLSSRLFPWLGQGKLDLQTTPEGGRAHGEYLHYSFAWREKYGSKISRRHPIDAFAAGYAAAATEVAFDLAPGSLRAGEDGCYVCREPSCHFELEAHPSDTATAPVDRGVVERSVAAPVGGREETAIEEIARGLKDYVLGVHGDERGLVQGFGVYITRHLTSYYNATAFDTIHRIERTSPEMTPVVEDLFGESGHVCAFYTCGNILLSPEWEAMVGPVKGDVEEILIACVAICRALGFGHWTIEDFVPGERFVMRSSSNYEAPFYLARYGRADKPRSYFFANAARAFMQLAHDVDWTSRPTLDDKLYQSLFKNGFGWNMEQTSCLTQGDEHCEVVVTRG